MCSTKQQQKEWTKSAVRGRHAAKEGRCAARGVRGGQERLRPACHACAPHVPLEMERTEPENPPISTHPNWTSLPSQLKGTTFRPGEIIHPSCPVVQSHRRVQAPAPNLKEALGVPCPCSMLAPYCPGLGAHEGHVSVPPQM